MYRKVIFKFGITLNPSLTIENKVNSDGAYNSNGGGVVASALHSSPIFPVYNDDGSFCFAQIHGVLILKQLWMMEV